MASLDAGEGMDPANPVSLREETTTLQPTNRLEERMVLEDVLAAATEIERPVLTLHIVEEWSYQEIADALGETKSHVCYLISRVVRRAQGMLQHVIE